MAATRIEPEFVKQIWGVHDLSPWFPPQTELTGEVWFPAGAILIKFLFTSGKLSVQVHPDDTYAAKHEGSVGKTEMWHILRAGPRAELALGFKTNVEPEQVRTAALDKSIEEMLSFYRPSAGDTYFTPAGTVHALGPDLALCEIQQNSKVTYRLYDYDRGRELHLDKSMDVLDPVPHSGKSTPQPLPDGGQLLAQCPYFVTERHEPRDSWIWPGGVMIVLEGEGTLRDGTSQHRFRLGEVWSVDAGATIEPNSGLALLRTYVPRR
ncbi:MAG: class I mannose-6-phosphate isomerase [Bryobacteraceae bacterium]